MLSLDLGIPLDQLYEHIGIKILISTHFLAGLVVGLYLYESLFQGIHHYLMCFLMSVLNRILYELQNLRILTLMTGINLSIAFLISGLHPYGGIFTELIRLRNLRLASTHALRRANPCVLYEKRFCYHTRKAGASHNA